MNNDVDVFGWNSSSYGYIDICKKAVDDDEYFQKFKNDPMYRVVLEHLDPGQGAYYLECIERSSLRLSSELEKFSINDTLGKPKDIVPVQGLDGKQILITPSTIRYVKVLADLLFEFGSLDGMKIIEVGGGYGGQALVISQDCNFDSYHLIDLEDPANLAKKYLSHFKIENVGIYTPDALPDMDFDLVVSNYAFSEVAKSTQDLYIDKVLSRCARGYITWNNENPDDQFGETPYDYEPLVKRLSEFHTLREGKEDAPGSTHPIIIWGK